MIGIRRFSSCNILQSMIGRRLIKYSNEVNVDYTPASKITGVSLVGVKGPLGELKLELPGFVQLNFSPKNETDSKCSCQICVIDSSNAKQRSMWGTARALLNNMIIGVHEGYTVPLRFEGVGYRVI